ncbi:MAG: AI-2E family transporter [Thiofilum sp.]|uniref:AI-2E family transporter n=1 Tax=Thiofilum sp. TaxID=2212733 RepID=UPI0025D7767D|nr:AI-2E family transporter [Thiofilum sp.]MBK8451968.1 AI-2E family transporter [Thiofilum sp.]
MLLNNKSILWLILLVAFLSIVYLLKPILMPFLAGALIAYLLDPVTDRLEVKGLSRTAAVTIVFLLGFFLVLIILLLIIPIIETQLRKLLEVLPGYISWGVSTLGPFLEKNFNIDLSVFEVERLKEIIASNWRSTGGFIKNTLQTVSKSGFVLLEWLANLALIPLISFYLLRDWDRLVAYIHDLLPRSIEPIVTRLTIESDQVLGAFLRGQLSVMVVLGFIYALGLSLVGLEFGVLIGIIAGLVSFVPYLGVIIGLLLACLAVIFQTQSLGDLLGVFAVFGLGQLVESFVLTPLLVGDKIGLHPVIVIFSIMAGGELFGFVGILLALPVTAIIAVVLRYIISTYRQSYLYKVDDTQP